MVSVRVTTAGVGLEVGQAHLSEAVLVDDLAHELPANATWSATGGTITSDGIYSPLIVGEHSSSASVHVGPASVAWVEAEVTLTLRDSDGAALATTTVTVPAASVRQLSVQGPFGGLQPSPVGAVEISSQMPILAYIAIVDPISQDPAYVLQRPLPSLTEILLAFTDKRHPAALELAQKAVAARPLSRHQPSGGDSHDRAKAKPRPVTTLAKKPGQMCGLLRCHPER